MKKLKLKPIICLLITLWGSGLIVAYQDRFADVLGIILIIFATALYYSESESKLD